MRRFLSLLIITAFCISCTAWVAWVFYQHELENINANFEKDIGKRVYALENEMVKMRATLRHWKSFYEAADDIEPQQFARIAEDVLGTYPSLQLLAWAPMIVDQERPLLEQYQNTIAPGFQILEINPKYVSPTQINDARLIEQIENFDPQRIFQPSGARPVYFPITVTEPSETTGFLRGMDMLSVNRMQFDEKMTEAIRKGDIMGLPAAPSPFSPEHETIFIALVPIKPSSSHPQRIPKPIRGFIVATFDIESLLSASSLSDLPDDIYFRLIDKTGDDGLFNLYQTEDFTTGLGRMYTRPVLEVFERKWVVLAAPKVDYILSRLSYLPLSVAVGGLLFTALLLLYLQLLQRHAEVVQHQVEERTSQLSEANSNLNKANARLEELSRIDPLTEVANRRFFNESIEKEWNRSLRDNLPIAILIIDVDHFKGYNDYYGHLKGDDCLRVVASELDSVFSRSGDLVARYGGEEFAVILPNAGGEAMRMAEKCRASIEKLQIEHKNSGNASVVTISVGISSVTPTGQLKATYLLDSADKGLYIAKEHGRNRVIYHTCHARLGKFQAA